MNICILLTTAGAIRYELVSAVCFAVGLFYPLIHVLRHASVLFRYNEHVWYNEQVSVKRLCCNASLINSSFCTNYFLWRQLVWAVAIFIFIVIYLYTFEAVWWSDWNVWNTAASRDNAACRSLQRFCLPHFCYSVRGVDCYDCPITYVIISCCCGQHSTLVEVIEISPVPLNTAACTRHCKQLIETVIMIVNKIILLN